MKKLILFTILMHSYYCVFSQIVASVPVLEAQNTTSLKMQSTNLEKTIATLKQTTEQTEKMRKSLEIMKETISLVENVNNKITSSTETIRTISDQITLLDNIHKVKARLIRLENINPSEQQTVAQKFDTMISFVNEIGAFVKDILTSGIYIMDDAQRLVEMKNAKAEIRKVHYSLVDYERKLLKINNDRAFFKSF